MELYKTLTDIGLTEKEAKIYLVLLELGEALPSFIAKKAGVKRPTTYLILEQLCEKGLASTIKKSTYEYYQPIHPKVLIEDQEEKLLALQKALPELIDLHSLYSVSPQVSFFQGREGIIHIMEDSLKTKTELLCWADVTLATQTLLKDYYPSYIGKKIKRKVWLRGIFSYDKYALDVKRRSKKELREVYLIPKDKFPFKNEINIYDDKVAIISHQDQLGVIIQNQNIADTQKAIFNLGFEYAKILEKDLLTKEDKAFLKNNE